MKSSKGFTLIELVVVIVILGILSVTAMPKFLNLTTDAKNTSLKGLQAALVSGADMGYAQLAIDGLEDESYVVSINEPKIEEWCEICAFSFGYPTNMANTWEVLVDGVGTGDESFAMGVKNGSDNLIFAFNEDVKGGVVKTDDCYLQFTPATVNERYKLELVECK